MSTIDYSQAIPNNVNLSTDRVLQRALEQWQPNFLSWWGDMGPIGAMAHNVYLRTATSAHPSGWAHFDYVKMPDYRWGIFSPPPQSGGSEDSLRRRIGQGGLAGCAGRTSRQSAAHHRDSRRYRARLGGA